jgi:putative transcriptional regulator
MDACGILYRVIKLRLSEMLKKRGRTPYWLSKQTGIRYASIWQMNRGEVERLHIATLDLICEALKCQPGDLLVRVSERKATKKRKKKRR